MSQVYLLRLELNHWVELNQASACVTGLFGLVRAQSLG